MKQRNIHSSTCGKFFNEVLVFFLVEKCLHKVKKKIVNYTKLYINMYKKSVHLT